MLGSDAILTLELWLNATARVEKALAEIVRPSVSGSFPSAKSVLRLLHDHDVYASSVQANAPNDQEKLLTSARLSECLGAVPAFASSELVAHQVGFVLPVLDALQSAPASLKLQRMIERGEQLCSRIFYEEDNSLLQGAVTVHWQSRGDKWVLDGELPALLMSEETGYHLVFATEATTSGLKVFLVPTKETGVSVRSKAPVSEDGSVVLAKVALSRVELSSGSCLGDFAPARAATLVLENRILATCRINGRVRAILDGVIEYLKARESNGIPILSLDVIKHRLAALDAESSMSRALGYRALEAYVEGGETGSLTNSGKYFASKLLQIVAREALHLGGVAHYCLGSLLSRCYQEARWQALLVERDEFLLAGV